MAYTLTMSEVHKSFGSVHVLRGIDLQVAPGEVVALLGANGAGKTTAVRILSTLLMPDQGSVTVAGHDAVREPRAVRAAISLTGQYAAVDEVLTGRENLRLMARLRRLDRRAARSRVTELLERFDLVDAADRRVATYSGGMRRRLDIALSLVRSPVLLVLDEPTTGLDPRSRVGVWESVAELRDAGVTVLLTTQYLDEADRLADRITVIDAGVAVADGTADELKARVGGDTLQLMLADDEALARADAVLRRWPAGAGRLDGETTSIHVPTDGSGEGVRAVLDLMAQHGVDVPRLALHRPTLDEVFMRLTGASAGGARPAADDPVEVVA